MNIQDMLPGLDADALKTVRANAMRLSEQGNPKQKAQALTALPLIEAEEARRAELAPTPAKKTAKPKVPKAIDAATPVKRVKSRKI